MNKFIPFIVIFLLFTCSQDNQKPIIEDASKGSIQLSISLGNFFIGGSGTDSPWNHQYQESVDITFSSTTSVYSQTVTFDPNDLSTFPDTEIPYDTYSWSIENTGNDIAVSSVLYIYGNSSSNVTINAPTTTIPLGLVTDFALVTISSENLNSARIRYNGTNTDLTTQDGYYFGYINANNSNYDVLVLDSNNQTGVDTIASPEAYTHYNYQLTQTSNSALSVSLFLIQNFVLEDRGIVTEADDDQDGISNTRDFCPGTRSGAPVDVNGCLDVIEIDSNGITLKAKPSARVGDQQEINGITYTIVDDLTIRNLVAEGVDVSTLVTTLVTDMNYLFSSKTSFNQNIGSWDVSNVTNMRGLFQESNFNGDIALWNTSKVTTMAYMFNNTPFSGDLSNWDVSNVVYMSSMFSNALAFDGDLSTWNVSKVIDMSYMFNNTSFNGEIGNWDVSSVLNMTFMFKLTPFNQEISNWNVGNVLDMSQMFANSSFNGDISNWNTSRVTNMLYMFSTSPFNGDISNWDVSNVTNMGAMFENTPFNANLSNWDVGKVTNMAYMFSNSSFNQPLASWEVDNVLNMEFMFKMTPFNQDISNWNVANVVNMSQMFADSNFSSSVSNWDTSSVANMTWMFSNTPFNEDLSSWNVDAVVQCSNFSAGTFNWTLPKPNFTNCTE